MSKTPLFKKSAVGVPFVLVVVILVTVLWGAFNELMLPLYNPDEVTLYYELNGNGPKKLILLHGLMGSSRYWDHGLDELEKSHQALSIDLLGFGNSPKPNGKYDLEEHLSRLEQVIQKEGFDDGSAVLVGHSLGGILSLRLMEKHPDWFKGAAVIAMPVFQNSEEAYQRVIDSSFLTYISIGHPFSRVLCNLRPLLQQEWLAPLFDVPTDVYMDAMKHNWYSINRTFENIILKSLLTQHFPVIQEKPLLFIHGTEDKVASIDDVQAFAAQFAHSNVLAIEGGSHQVFLEQLSLMNYVAAAFID